jgi:hypothetical protein
MKIYCSLTMLHRSSLPVVCRLQRHFLTSLCGSSRRLPTFSVSCRSSTPWTRKSSSSSKINCKKSKERVPITKRTHPTSLSPFVKPFWTCRHIWRRAGINTLRCLVGCTFGDFSALWMLQTYFPELGMGTIMGLSSIYTTLLNILS